MHTFLLTLFFALFSLNALAVDPASLPKIKVSKMGLYLEAKEVPEFLKFGVLSDVQQVLFVNRHSKLSGLTASTNLQGTVLRRYVDTKQYIDALNILREARLNEAKLKGCSVVNGLKSYQQLLTERRYLDYSAIMLEAVRAIQADKELQARLAARVQQTRVRQSQAQSCHDLFVVEIGRAAGRAVKNHHPHRVRADIDHTHTA